MPLFKCSDCGCIENTALSRYWMRLVEKPPKPALCSACDPDIGKWHDQFPKESAKGYKLGDDGFIYSEKDIGPDGYFAHHIKKGQLKIVGDA